MYILIILFNLFSYDAALHFCNANRFTIGITVYSFIPDLDTHRYSNLFFFSSLRLSLVAMPTSNTNTGLRPVAEVRADSSSKI